MGLDNQEDSESPDDCYYDSSASSSTYGGRNLKSYGSLHLNKYGSLNPYTAREDLSQILTSESPLLSDVEMDTSSRLSLSPNDLRAFNPPSLESRNNSNSENVQLAKQTLRDETSNTGATEIQPVVLEITSPPRTTRRRLEMVSKSRLSDFSDRIKPSTVIFQPEALVFKSPLASGSSSPRLVSVQSTVKDSTRSQDVTSLQPSADENEINTQLDLSDLADAQVRVKPSLGPRSITISGTTNEEGVTSAVTSAGSRYQKLTRPSRAHEDSTRPPFVSTVHLSTSSPSPLSRSLTVDSPAGYISKGGFTLNGSMREHSNYKSHVPFDRSRASSLLTPAKVRTATMSASTSPSNFKLTPYLDMHNTTNSTGLLDRLLALPVPQGQPVTTTQHAPRPGIVSVDTNAKASALWETEVDDRSLNIGRVYAPAWPADTSSCAINNGSS